MNSARQYWREQRRIGGNRKHEIWIGPWWYSHSICLSVELHWYSGYGSPSSSTYQKAVLWSINVSWESKIFFFDSIGYLPRNSLERGPASKGSLVSVTGYIYKGAENRIFNLCGSAEPLILPPPSQQWRMRFWASRPCLDSLEENSCKKIKKIKTETCDWLWKKMSLNSLYPSTFWLILLQQ